MFDLNREIDRWKSAFAKRKACSKDELQELESHLREEITDRLGDVDLDPCDAGIVRRDSVRLIDPAKGDKAIDSQKVWMGVTETF